jgi:dienelactone hydrolase
VKSLQEHKQPATITTFPNAYHGFDDPSGKLRVRKDVPNGVNGPEAGVTVGPDPDAREAAKREIDHVLRAAQLISARK